MFDTYDSWKADAADRWAEPAWLEAAEGELAAPRDTTPCAAPEGCTDDEDILF